VGLRIASCYPQFSKIGFYAWLQLEINTQHLLSNLPLLVDILYFMQAHLFLLWQPIQTPVPVLFVSDFAQRVTDSVVQYSCPTSTYTVPCFSIALMSRALSKNWPMNILHKKLDSTLRNDARTDKDFDNIRDNHDFKRLIGE